MRSDGVVVPLPASEDDLGLAQAVEDLAVEQFIPSLGVEALDVAVLARTAWGDSGGLRAYSLDPVLHGLRHKLRPVVRANVSGHPA
jgi:hypothetical protein